MLKVTNGSMTFTVTRGAYKNYYRHKGFHVVGSDETQEIPGVDYSAPGMDPSDEDPDEGEDEELEEEEEVEPELSEIPLSEMNFSQLCEYAEELNIDYTGVRSKKDLRQLIKDTME